MPSNDMKYDEMFCTKGDNAELERIRDYVLANAIEFGFDSSTAQKITLAVDEACSNLIRHSYNYDTDKKICISIDCQGKEFVVNIYDEGRQFDPLSAESPDMNEYMRSFKRGGLGIHIIKLIMDEVSYMPNVGSPARNKLSLKKYLN